MIFYCFYFYEYIQYTTKTCFMKRNLITGVFLFFACLLVIDGYSQEINTEKKVVESVNGVIAVQVGVPSTTMQRAIKNDMGNLGFGAGLEVLTNPFTWGKNKRNSPLRIGGELGYTYYGRFLSEVNINGYKGDYKTSYGILQLNAILQLRPQYTEVIRPFIELLAGGSFYLSSIKENLDLIESALGIETFSLGSHSSASFNKGIAVGCSFGNPRKEAGRFTLRVSYNRGNSIKYIVRNSLEYDPSNNSLQYQVDKAPVSYFMIQIGVGR
jgi:hypothetical protein